MSTKLSIGPVRILKAGLSILMFLLGVIAYTVAGILVYLVAGGY